MFDVATGTISCVDEHNPSSAYLLRVVLRQLHRIRRPVSVFAYLLRTIWIASLSFAHFLLAARHVTLSNTLFVGYCCADDVYVLCLLSLDRRIDFSIVIHIGQRDPVV